MSARPLSIFLIFLRLGCTSFGGPIAHLGYFREEFVSRRKWLSEQAFADVVALAQFVPGPASSQTGFAIGLMRGGLPGALAALAGFTLPSAALMVLAAYGLSFAASEAAQGLIHGLMVLAAAVVAQAVWSMGRILSPDAKRAAFAFAAAALLIVAPSAALQLGVIAAGALFGLIALRPETSEPGERLAGGRSHKAAALALVLFFVLLFGLPLAASAGGSELARFVDAFYRAGALVFGGGHVVLPLLQEALVASGYVARDAFLAGYGAAQALPGPLFSFAAFLGFQSSAGPGGLMGAALATIAIFLPGFLLIYGALPFWDGLRRNARARAALAGVNSAVVGILGAALYNPIWTSAVTGPRDAALALVLFALFAVLRWPVLAVMLLAAAAGVAPILLS
jgi:chromate transporter